MGKKSTKLLNTDDGADAGKGVFYQLGSWLGRLMANISDADHTTYMSQRWSGHTCITVSI